VVVLAASLVLYVGACQLGLAPGHEDHPSRHDGAAVCLVLVTLLLPVVRMRRPAIFARALVPVLVSHPRVAAVERIGVPARASPAWLERFLN
jgi:hypothetical protein